MQIRLKEIRTQKGISIRELSKISGVSKGSIEKMEGQNPNPRIETICRIANALRVELSKLVVEEME